MATRHERVVAGLIYLDALYEYAYSDGKSYDNLYTAEHPWHLALPPGEAVPSDPGMAVLLGMHEYRSIPVSALAICAVPQILPPMLKDNPQATASFENGQQRVAERYDRIERDLPHVRIILLPNAAHFIFQLV